jgi:hypothetical protein
MLSVLAGRACRGLRVCKDLVILLLTNLPFRVSGHLGIDVPPLSYLIVAFYDSLFYWPPPDEDIMIFISIRARSSRSSELYHFSESNSLYYPEGIRKWVI